MSENEQRSYLSSPIPHSSAPMRQTSRYRKQTTSVTSSLTNRVSLLSLSDKSTVDVVGDIDYATGSFCSSCSIPPPPAGGLRLDGVGPSLLIIFILFFCYRIETAIPILCLGFFVCVYTAARNDRFGRRCIMPTVLAIRIREAAY